MLGIDERGFGRQLQKNSNTRGQIMTTETWLQLEKNKMKSKYFGGFWPYRTGKFHLFSSLVNGYGYESMAKAKCGFKEDVRIVSVLGNKSPFEDAGLVFCKRCSRSQHDKAVR